MTLGGGHWSRYSLQAGGMHPTGMLSCILSKSVSWYMKQIWHDVRHSYLDVWDFEVVSVRKIKTNYSWLNNVSNPVHGCCPGYSLPNEAFGHPSLFIKLVLLIMFRGCSLRRYDSHRLYLVCNIPSLVMRWKELKLRARLHWVSSVSVAILQVISVTPCFPGKFLEQEMITQNLTKP